MTFMFENLEVYQKVIDFIDQTTSLTDHFPRGYYFLSDQLNRAAVSIVTNIAEGLEIIAKMISGLINGLDNRKV